MRGRDDAERTRLTLHLSVPPTTRLADPPELIMAMRRTLLQQAEGRDIGPVTVALRMVPTARGNLLMIMSEAFAL